MALRRTTLVVVLTALAILTGSSALLAQSRIVEGVQDSKYDRLSGSTEISKRTFESVPGTRPLTIHAGRIAKSSLAPASATFPPPKYRTSGKEFFVVFTSVIGSGQRAGDPEKRSLYISSRGRTRVKVKYERRTWEQNIITVPGQVTIVELPAWGVLNANQYENIFDVGVSVTAEDDITVYGYSHENLSTDGFLVLPKEALGQHYLVASLRNSLNYTGIDVGDPNPRSSFTILATEDQTLITFKLTATSYSGRMLRDSTYSIMLNRGEVFPIMARDTGVLSLIPYTEWIDDTTSVTYYIQAYTAKAQNADCDLTGSEIWSDKPIAVYSGHERASSPDDHEFNLQRVIYDRKLGISRDHLTEQMPPVELWGSEFFVMSSTSDARNTRPANGDLVRVISAGDGNVVTVNGVAVATVNANKYYQFYSNNIAHVVTSQPALVVKYMQSMAYNDQNANGDPDMTIVPPVSNLSLAYTLPVVNNNLVFREPFVNVLVHKDGQKDLRINGKPAQSRVKTIPGTDYLWYSEWGSPGEWRIECPLPCYAESYAYGYADSYTFAGGGDFGYQDSLSAEDLDFRTLLIGRSKQLSANIKAGYDLNLLADSISLYGVTWLSGDTNNFSMLDTITTPIRLGPGDKLPVRFSFRPDEVKTYRARATVWSSSRAIVHINVVGQGGLMTVEITPTVINFGRVRIGKDSTRQYSVLFGGDDNLAKVELTGRSFTELQTPELGFHLDDVPPSFHEAGTAYTASVMFRPMTEGWRDTGFTVFAGLPQTPEVSERLNVRLIGRGVEPKVQTEDQAYGEVRIGLQTAYKDVQITNLGSDTTQIKSIRIESGDVDDFTLDPTSLPPMAQFLDTTDVEGSRYSFRAKFNPNDTGSKSVQVRIETLEQVIYSTLTGRGVEPYIVADPIVLDFGTIQSPKFPATVINPTMVFTVKNIGTYQAILNKLQQTTEGGMHFTMRPLPPVANVLEQPIAKSDSIQVEVTFLVTKVGDFYDTVSVMNDTRNQPLVTFIGRVVTDIVVTPDKLDYDTVRNCDPVEQIVTILNPNSVGIVIDSIYFKGQSNGFSIGGTPFLIPVAIDAGETFSFPVQYIFPKDSVSGLQTATLVFRQWVGDEFVELEVTLQVYRSIRTLKLLTVKPSYTPNVSDGEPFRLPITIEGGIQGLRELDNFKLLLHFDNDLFKPVGLDLTGSLTDADGGMGTVVFDPYDSITRTFTITGENLNVSSRSGNLLLTVLVRALLTVDTFATVTPELNLDERPCAYAIAKQGVLLEYADDCGDDLLRSKLREETGLKINSVSPDPLVTGNSSEIKFNYTLAQTSMIECEVLNTSGAVVYRTTAMQAEVGEGTIAIPGSELGATGLYVLRVYHRPISGQEKYTLSRNFRVIR